MMPVPLRPFLFMLLDGTTGMTIMQAGGHCGGLVLENL
jgi:hypothetical protein